MSTWASLLLYCSHDHVYTGARAEEETIVASIKIAFMPFHRRDIIRDKFLRIRSRFVSRRI